MAEAQRCSEIAMANDSMISRANRSQPLRPQRHQQTIEADNKAQVSFSTVLT